MSFEPSQFAAVSGIETVHNGGLRTIWIRLFLFLVPVLLIVCLPVYLIDPYGLFSKQAIVNDGVRFDTATRVNHVLLGIISFTKHPAPNILLGDSQMNHFKADEIGAITYRQYSNLSYGGGTLAESIATFWYAARTVRLESVYFGMSYYSFTDNSRDRVGAAVRIINNPAVYFSSGDVLEAAFDDAAAQFFRHAVSYGPNVDVSAFWQQQLGELARRKQTYSASEHTLTELRAIVRYCRAHGIKLFFVIPPEHEDARTRMQQLGMYDEYSAFKEAVAALGPTYDCDIANDITRDAANFQDPYHTTRAAASLITKSIWTGSREWCDIRGAE
jgi:hypothetical protein